MHAHRWILVAALLLAEDSRPLIPAVEDWLSANGALREYVRTADELLARCLRGRPRVVIADARTRLEEAESAWRRFVGALAAPLVGLGGEGSAVPMAVVVCGAALLSLTAVLTLARERRA